MRADKKYQPHEKVRFTRAERIRLGLLPSAIVQEPKTHPNLSTRSRAKRYLLVAASGFGLLILLLVGILTVVGVSGLGNEALRTAAQTALVDIAGNNAVTEFGDARFGLAGPGLVAIELDNAKLTDVGRAEPFISVQRLHIGLTLFPLLRGKVQLNGISLSGVRLNLASGPGAPGAVSDFTNERGLIDPDRVASKALYYADSLYEALNGKFRGDVVVRDLAMDLPNLGGSLLVDRATIANKKSELRIATQGTFAGKTFTLDAKLWKEGSNPAGAKFESNLLVQKLSLQTASKPNGEPGISASSDFRLSANGSSGEVPQIKASIEAPNFTLQFANGGRQTGSYRLDMTLEEGTGKVEINRFAAGIGQTNLRFHGAFGPAPVDVSAKPVYRYELVSDGSRIAPADSPEPPLTIFSRIAGFLDTEASKLTADQFDVRTTHGDILGSGALVFAKGKSPAAFLAITVPELPVSHAKQLWPWRAADGARSWVLSNVFGGTIRNSRVELSAVAGRLESGVPLGPDEVSGHFEISNTRFDTAGEIPPIRDAEGTVDFRGNIVNITLKSGTAFLPSGRTVDASNGVFDITVEADKPLAGALEIDVAGDADAIAELATFKPIDADSYLDLAPEDFAGRASGHVSAIIPLGEVPDDDLISWLVDLTYQDLSISEPFDGQILSEADGSIRVDPKRVFIDANGRLNGLPADINIVAPLDEAVDDAHREIRLVLDDEARDKIASGLNSMVSGKVIVDVNSMENGARKIEADLTKAELYFPWIGWRKGPGIPATMSFLMEESGDAIHLTELKVSGETFSISGSASLVDSRISDATFDRIQLNREDDFTLSIKRSGRGYDLNIAGARVDARSLIKQFFSDKGLSETGLEDVPVRLSAKADTVLGFGGEILSNVTVDYSGTGADVSGLELAATTGSGHKFTARNDSGDGKRSIQMQSSDAGSILRFLDIYKHMQGGSIDLRLSGRSDEPLRGQMDARDFWVVDEPRLQSLVSTTPEGGDRSLNDAVKRDIDVSRAKFDRGYVKLEKGAGYLAIGEGILRGPLIGSTFQGMLYDPNGEISVTGTFMPAYGFNRMFAEIPLVGTILGNGRDRGLIGITYKLSGDAESPHLKVNPISVIAPGIFRSIFEFR